MSFAGMEAVGDNELAATDTCKATQLLGGVQHCKELPGIALSKLFLCVALPVSFRVAQELHLVALQT